MTKQEFAEKYGTLLVIAQHKWFVAKRCPCCIEAAKET